MVDLVSKRDSTTIGLVGLLALAAFMFFRGNRSSVVSTSTTQENTQTEIQSVSEDMAPSAIIESQQDIFDRLFSQQQSFQKELTRLRSSQSGLFPNTAPVSRTAADLNAKFGPVEAVKQLVILNRPNEAKGLIAENFRAENALAFQNRTSFLESSIKSLNNRIQQTLARINNGQ